MALGQFGQCCFDHDRRDGNGLQGIGVIEKRLKGGVAANAGFCAGRSTGLSPAQILRPHRQVSLEGFLEISTIADALAMPHHFKKRNRQAPHLTRVPVTMRLKAREGCRDTASRHGFPQLFSLC